MILACSLPGSGGCSSASRAIRAITSAARPCRMSSPWAVTQSSMAGSRGAWKHQAAFHRYSSTWMKSTRMARVMPRAAAWAWNRPSWWMSPSTSAIQVRQVTGVAAVGLVEDLADGDVAAGGDVAGVPAVLRPRRLLLALAGIRAHDLLRGPRLRRPGRRRRRRTRSRPSACSPSSPRSRPACRRSAPAAPGPWSGGGAPRGASPRPCRPPRSPAAAGSRPACPGPGPAGPAGPGAGPGRTAPRPRPRPR